MSTEIAIVYSKLVKGIKDYAKTNQLEHAVVGLSGGIDSAVVVALAVAALGSNNVHGVTIPSHVTGEETLYSVKILSDNLEIQCDIAPITELYKTWESEAIKHHRVLLDITKQNAQARLRAIILMEYSNQIPRSFLLNTGNQTERTLGFCTLYGDTCGAIAVIGELSKAKVYELAHECNKQFHKEVIPAGIIARIPTPELVPGRYDRDELPADYNILSPLVEDIVAKVSVEELNKKYSEKIVTEVYKLIARNSFKLHQVPPTLKI